jgi:hypothetical protein
MRFYAGGKGSMARRVALLVILMTVAMSAQGRQDKDLANPKKWPVVLKGDHYQVWSSATEKDAQDMLRFMELVFATYTQLLDLPRPPAQKLVIVLYKNRDEYLAGGAPGMSAAYYNGSRLVGYSGDKSSFSFFAHEGFHQFTDWGLKAIHKAPPWFTEGMADCIGNHVVRDGKLYVCAKEGQIAQGRIRVIQAAISKNEQLPLSKLLEVDHSAFMSQAQLLYPQAWSFCHFLMASPHYEDPKNQIPHGKYWKVLQRYILAISKSGVKPGKALEAALVDETGRPLDVQTLEKEWRDYVLAYPVELKPSIDKK